MRPRLRLLYSAFLASYIPFFTKRLADKCKPINILYLSIDYKDNQDYRLFYVPNTILGFANGSIMAGLILT